MKNLRLNNISDALEDIAQGKAVIVVDNHDRENEGDLICAAEKITPQMIAFMATHGRGLICVSLLPSRCEELQLDLMVGRNTALHNTPFTVSVDLIGSGCTTGISAHDRAKTILALIDNQTKPEQLGRPGHVFPLKARPEGVLRRVGHTEAATDLARLAGLYPAGVLVEIMNEDGTMARGQSLRTLADKFSIKIISIRDLIGYRLTNETLIKRVQEVELPCAYGTFRLISYRQQYTQETHLALVKGTWNASESLLVRVHSSCLTGDVFGSARCDCGKQLHQAMRQVEQAGKGVILYMNQEGRGIGLENKLKAYALQEQGMDTVEANTHLGFVPDARDYGIGAQILRDLGIQNMRLMTNNPKKRVGLQAYGLRIVENVPLEIPANPHNIKYLSTKRDKLGHEILNDPNVPDRH